MVGMRAMSDDAIEFNRELLAEYFHLQHAWIADFYPPEEWADEVDLEAGQFESWEEAEGYARGNLIAMQDDLRTLGQWFDIDPGQMAREWAEEYDKYTFERRPFVVEDE